MSNMSIEEALKTLTKIEAATLFLKCEGKNYQQIGDELGYSKHTITYFASNFYAKLGIDASLHHKKRMEILQETYCPAIHRLFRSLDEILDGQTWPPEPTTEPVPNNIYLPAVIEDDLLVIPPSPLVPVSTGTRVTPPPHPNGKTPGRRILDALKVLTIGLMTLGCVAIVAIIAYLLGGARGGVATTIRETVIASPITLRETVLVTSIATAPAIAFSPEDQQTATVEPTQPARLETLLFEDSFDEKFDTSVWTSYGDEVTWVDGKITTNGVAKIAAGDINWTDYVITFDVEGLHGSGSVDTHLTVSVRMKDPGNMLEAVDDYYNRRNWVIWTDGASQIVPEVSFPDPINTFAAYVEGDKAWVEGGNKFAFTGHESGRIHIQFNRNIVIDNVRVRALP